ncbi:major capsid protein, partial [Candidatus Dependentiae bacterium]|nr:major capsid protein [Candidatus Dependentiae bacterium]
MLNPFEIDAFSMTSLTASINILPNNYGRCREMNLFPEKGVSTRSIIVEEQNGVLNLLPTLPVGSPGTQNKMGKRKVRTFNIPHIPLDDVILPSEYDGVRAFGTENQVSGPAQIMNDHLQAAKNKFGITIEHLRMGALKGIILDADGSTLYNLYTEFGITPKEVPFALTVDETDVRSKCLTVNRHIEDNLMGEVMSKVYALCSEGFFDALISHPEVEKAFLYHSEASERLGGDPRKGFKFGGITFEEYRGTATDGNGTDRKFIAADEAHAFPMGTMET